MFRFSKDTCEERQVYLKSEKIVSVLVSKTNELINIIHNSVFTNHQENLSKKVKGNEFLFDYIDKLYYHCHKITLYCSRFFIDSLRCLKIKNTTINHNKNDSKCFQCPVTSGLNHTKILTISNIISNIKKTIDNHN